MDERTINDIVQEIGECVGPLAGMTVCRNCILDEGDIIVSDVKYTNPGVATQELRMEHPLWINDEVSLSTHLDGSFKALMIVEPYATHEARVIGRIVSVPTLIKFPSSNYGVETLGERLNSYYCRQAYVEIDYIKLKNLVHPE